jgi:signal transduction histidine kinase
VRKNNLKAIAFCLTLVIASVLSLPAFAQDTNPGAQKPLVLTDQQGEYPLGRPMDILEDPGGELTIDQVTSPEFASRFTPSQADVPIYGYSDSVFWLRLRFRNETRLTYQWLLEVNFPNLNYVDLYIPSGGGGYRVKESGVLRPFDTRDLPYYHVVFNLPLAPQTEQTFYIRVQSGSSMTLSFTLWSPQAFATNTTNTMLGIGLFYGALLIMLGYHLIVFYSLRETNYFYFILVLISSIIFWATYEGVADQYLWPGWSQYKLPLLVITMSLFFMASLKFSDVFLEQKIRAPQFHRIFNLFIGLWGLMIAIVPFFSYGFMAEVTSILIFLTPVVAALAGFFSWRKGYHQAQFYLISWLGYLLGLFTVELVRAGFIPSTAITEKFYHIGLIWLVLMWSLALANRINELKRDTEDANRKLSQSQQQLSQTLEGLPIGVAVYSPERKPTYINEHARNILANPARGIVPSVTVGRTIDEAAEYFSFRVGSSDEVYPLEKIPTWQAFEGRTTSVDNIEADLIDRRVPLEIMASPVLNDQGKVESVVVAFQDITQRKKADAELEQYRLQLEQLVSQRTGELDVVNKQLKAEIAERQRLEEILRLRLEWLVIVNKVNQVVVNTSDLPQAYQSFTEMIKKLFGATDALLAEVDSRSNELKLLAHSCRNGVHPDLTGLKLAFPSPVFSDQHTENGKPIVIPRDQLIELGGPLGAHFQAAQNQILVLLPLRCQENIFDLMGLEFLEAERYFSADEMTLVEKICIDIQQVQEKAQLAEQGRALIATEERNRLARDLHDSVTQVLFSASLVAEVLPQIWRRDPQLAQQSLENLQHLTHGALAEMRTLLLELRPSAVIKTPLSELLAQLTEAITCRINLPFLLFIEHIPTLPEDVHIGFYRIAQESLNNVVRHAQASQVSVSMSATPFVPDPTQAWNGEVKLMVRDDGHGFDTRDEVTQHLGLAIMGERATAIGAALSIESQPGNGTTVTLTWHN